MSKRKCSCSWGNFLPVPQPDITQRTIIELEKEIARLREAVECAKGRKFVKCPKG